MSRTAHHATWLSIVFLVTVAMHIYFWWRFVQTSELPRNWRAVVTTLLIVLAVSFPLPFFANRHFPSLWREAALWVGFTWMGLAFFLFVTLLAAEIPRLAFRMLAPADPLRRLFLSRSVTACVAVVGVGMGVFSFLNAARDPALLKIRITLPHLPKSLSGTTIVQISDIHVGGIIRRGFVKEVVRRVNELHPDLVAITGDLVDGSASRDGHTIDPIGDLKAKHGVYFVTGNHEYYAGVEEWLARLKGLGVRVLQNERIPIGSDKEGFDLAGVNDPTARWYGGNGPDVALALRGRDPSRGVVLLAHNPREIFDAAKQGVGLELSGHTHGGQIWPFSFLVKFRHPHLAGLYGEGNTQLYVNAGTGFWGPPMRFGTRSEITLIELVSPDS